MISRYQSAAGKLETTEADIPNDGEILKCNGFYTEPFFTERN